jgi:CheY-like chemotaxis protein
MNEGLQKVPSNILVVDDEEAIRYTYDLALSDAGYTVFYAESGEEAFAILRDEDINVIFLDLNLPDISGIELCRQVRCVKPNACILAITGYATHFDIAECYQAGFDDYLEKPVSLDLLQTSAFKAFKQVKAVACS